jgi:hypothetical protein
MDLATVSIAITFAISNGAPIESFTTPDKLIWAVEIPVTNKMATSSNFFMCDLIKF